MTFVIIDCYIRSYVCTVIRAVQVFSCLWGENTQLHVKFNLKKSLNLWFCRNIFVFC